MSGQPAARLAVVDVTAHRPAHPGYHAKVQALVSRILTDARIGGWAVSRHPAGDVPAEELLKATDVADAVVIAGGEDIHPGAYQAATGYQGETIHYPRADEGQLALVLRAVERGTPLLGICRGMQVINVALGGTLVRHIADNGLHRNHGSSIDEIFTSHAVVVEPGTGLARSLGDTRIEVRSAHHQGVADLGFGLRRSASAPDGVLEALEHVTAPVSGVQWHPEAPGAPAEQLQRLLSGLAGVSQVA
jgi:putative glutamine amidotransferase